MKATHDNSSIGSQKILKLNVRQGTYWKQVKIEHSPVAILTISEVSLIVKEWVIVISTIQIPDKVYIKVIIIQEIKRLGIKINPLKKTNFKTNPLNKKHV